MLYFSHCELINVNVIIFMSDKFNVFGLSHTQMCEYCELYEIEHVCIQTDEDRVFVNQIQLMRPYTTFLYKSNTTILCCLA